MEFTSCVKHLVAYPIETGCPQCNNEVKDKTIEILGECNININKFEFTPEELKLIQWDQYFLSMCMTVATNSKCHSRQIGALMVRDKSIISTGYNGPPRGIGNCDERHLVDPALMLAYVGAGCDVEDIPKGKCPRYTLGFKSGQGLEWCVAGHAERNVLINAAREGIPTKGATLYMDCGIPCTPCMVEIINAGISEIVVQSFSHYDSSAKYLLVNSKTLKCRKYFSPKYYDV